MMILRQTVEALLTLLMSAGLAFGAADEGPAHEDLNLTAVPAPLSTSSAAPVGPSFSQVAAEYNVPEDLLLALARLGSAFEDRGANPTIERGYGLMALRQNAMGGKSLTEAAQLTQVDAETLKIDLLANLRGAAAVLDDYAQREQIDRTAGLEAWVPVVVRYAGLDADSSRIFSMEVYGLLKSGLSITNSRGEQFMVPAHELGLDPEHLAPPVAQMNSPDYPAAAWNPAASCDYSTSTSTKDTVIIHTVEGSYAGCISWFQNCDSQVSSQYVVAYDGRITQMVRENQRAWHVSCYNTRSIGLEHEGYAASTTHPQAQYNASGDLVGDICNRWSIPKVHNLVGPGILGHVDVTHCCCGTHTDPGNGWDWSYYIGRVNATSPPSWGATLRAQSVPTAMTVGTSATVWLEFTNDGTGIWKPDETRLGTSGPQDRSSVFCTATDWLACNRPTNVDQTAVPATQTGRFTFVLRAPATPGLYVEKFMLVREGISWFGPEVTLTINVLPPDVPVPVLVFSDGFGGNLANWTQQTAYDYSATANHGTYPGAGAAFMAAGQSDQMYHAFPRPFAEGKASGYFRDANGGYKTGVGACGQAYRQALSLRDLGGAAGLIIDNGFASNVANGLYFHREVGAGASGLYTSYATRNPNTSCQPAWIYFETTITPARAGTLPSGTAALKAVDAAGTSLTNTNLPDDFSSFGIGRITLGLGASSAGEGYWDDITFEAIPPTAPLAKTPVVLSTSQIRWTFMGGADGRQFGLDVAGADGTVLTPAYGTPGWLDRTATSWIESGLAANTQYARQVRAWNGTLDGPFSAPISSYTLSIPPNTGSVAPSRITACDGKSITWTAVGGFGPGTVQYYRFVWNREPTHAWDGTEPTWSNGPLALAFDEPGTWYLHVRGFNGNNLANGSFDYAIAPPAFARADFDHDGDVDMDDFGRLQACFSGKGYAQTDPACALTRLDADADVDGIDLQLFRNCFSGPDQPADVCCAD